MRLPSSVSEASWNTACSSPQQFGLSDSTPPEDRRLPARCRYLFAPNYLGFLVGLGLFLLTYSLPTRDATKRDRTMVAAIILGTILPIIAAIERLVLSSQDARTSLWGYTGRRPAYGVPHQCIVCFT